MQAYVNAAKADIAATEARIAAWPLFPIAMNASEEEMKDRLIEVVHERWSFKERTVAIPVPPEAAGGIEWGVA